MPRRGRSGVVNQGVREADGRGVVEGGDDRLGGPRCEKTKTELGLLSKGGGLGRGAEPRGGHDRLGAPWSEKTKKELGREGGGAQARSVPGEEGRAFRTLWQGELAKEIFYPLTTRDSPSDSRVGSQKGDLPLESADPLPSSSKSIQSHADGGCRQSAIN